MPPWIMATAMLLVIVMLVAMIISMGTAHSQGDKSHIFARFVHSVPHYPYTTAWASTLLIVVIYPAVRAGGRRIATNTGPRRRRARQRFFNSLQDEGNLDPPSGNSSLHRGEPLQPSTPIPSPRPCSPTTHSKRPADGRATFMSHSDPGEGPSPSARRRGPSSAHAKKRRTQSVPKSLSSQHTSTPLPFSSSTRFTSMRPADGRSISTCHDVSVDAQELLTRKRGASLPHTRNRRSQAVPKPQPLTVPVVRMPQPFNDAFEDVYPDTSANRTTRSQTPFLSWSREEQPQTQHSSRKRRPRPVSTGPEDMPRVQYRAAIRRNTDRLREELKANVEELLRPGQKLSESYTRATREEQEQANSSTGGQGREEHANGSIDLRPKEQANSSTKEQANCS
eukprot:2220158-Amphidinium_carterae.1